MRVSSWLLGGILLLLLTGCTSVRYQYVAPQDAVGRGCVMECERLKAECEKKNDKIYQHCRHQREKEQRLYNLCRDTKKTCIEPKNLCHDDGSYQYGLCEEQYRKEYQVYQICQKKKCDYPRSCYRSDEAGCLPEYQRCFEVCGGMIYRIEE